MSLVLLIGCGPVTIDGAPPSSTETGADTGAPTVDDTGQPPLSGALFSDISGAPHDDVATVLVAEFSLSEAADAVWVAFTFEDEVWHESPPRALDAGLHSIPLLGIPADTEVTFELYGQVGDVLHTSAAQHTASTGALPSDVSDADLLAYDTDKAGDEPFLLTSIDVGSYNFYGPCYTVIIDRQGRVVWYRETSDSRLTMFPRVSEDGTHILIDGTTYYTFNGTEPSITRITLDYSQEEERMIPNMGLTYDELPDGTILYDYNEDSYRYYIQALYPDGSTEQIWSCYSWLSQYQSPGYWDCAPNTVLHNAAEDTIIYSMFETSTVVEVSWQTGEVVRQWGQLAGSWAVDPPSSNFELQHYPNYTPDGTLIVSTHIPGQPGQQRAREFTVDDETQTLTEIWTYGEGVSNYADYAGEAKRLENGHTLQGFGTNGAIHEISEDGELLWGVQWRNKLLGTATFVADLYALNEGGWQDDP